MQRQQNDANPATLHTGGALLGRAVDVVVLSNDDSLLLTLRDAADVEHAIWHAPSADAAVELLVSGHCGVLIVDLQAAHNAAAALFERLQAQFPELVLLATGARREQGSIITLISSGCIYRFLHKPVSPARATQFLGAAARRHHELAANASPAMTTVKQPTRPANRNPLLAAAAVAITLTLTAVWFFSRSVGSPTSQSVIGESASASMTRAADPRTADELAAQVAEALQLRDAPAAARALTALQAAQPDYPQLESLRERLLALSRAASAKTPMAKERPAARQARSTPNIDLARARIASKEFVEPANDSAAFYLRQARLQGENETISQILATDLGTRLLDQARHAIDADDPPQAQRWLAAARDIDREFELALPDLAVVAREVSDFVAGGTTVSSSSSSQAPPGTSAGRDKY